MMYISQLGCCHALWMLSETYSVIQYAAVWGCDRPTAAAPMTGSMTASMKKRSHRSVLMCLSNCSSECDEFYYQFLIHFTASLSFVCFSQHIKLV